MKTFDAVEDFLEDRSFRDYVLRNDPKAAALMKAYLEKYPEKSEVFWQAKQILTELAQAEPDWKKQRQNRLFEQIHRRLDLTPARADSKKSIIQEVRRKTDFASHLVALYVTAALVIVLGYLAYRSQGFLRVDSPVPETAVEWIVKENPKGQKSRFHLPDGSSVVVNSDSEIRFQSNFGKDHRQLFLSGEAYFEVASDSLLPFEVNSRGLVVVALGTEFNVSGYSNHHVNVQLAEGRVMVKREEDDTAVYLIPGEEVHWNGEKELKKQRFDKRRAFAWKDGRLVFSGHTWDEFILTLERWYGVEIESHGPQASGIRINGTFQDAYLSDVLESIGYAYGFEHRIDQKKVYITFKPN